MCYPCVPVYILTTLLCMYTVCELASRNEKGHIKSHTFQTEVSARFGSAFIQFYERHYKNLHRGSQDMYLDA